MVIVIFNSDCFTTFMWLFASPGLRLSAHKNFEVVREVSAAFQGILLVMPAAPFFPWFVTFTKVVNEYLEAPPFNFTNAYKEKGILKIVSICYF